MKLWQRRTLGILNLAGGALGVVSALMLLIARSNPIEWLFCGTFLLIYAWGIWCGIRLLAHRPAAERATLKYWLIQVPTFGSPILGYFLASGFHVTVFLQLTPIEFGANLFLGSTFNYSLMQTGKPWFVGVNLFALAVVWWLLRQLPPRVAGADVPVEGAPPG